MDNDHLGRLEKVELRNYWEREDTDFTTWLAEEENITLLGDTIGIDLEVERQEANVGSFRADILCRNIADNSFVVIEKQLERTDHSHLGQLITYAAGLDAVTLIWIVRTFAEEHRAALDWLNKITDDTFHFFGLEVALWKIGDSKPAPHFDIVAKPNEWSKTVNEAAGRTKGEMTKTQQLQYRFWEAFGETITATDSRLKVPKPTPSNWVGHGTGTPGCKIGTHVLARDGYVDVELTIDTWTHPTLFESLMEEKDSIVQACGFDLEWEKKPGFKLSRIRIKKAGDPQDETTWPVTARMDAGNNGGIRQGIPPSIETDEVNIVISAAKKTAVQVRGPSLYHNIVEEWI